MEDCRRELRELLQEEVSSNSDRNLGRFTYNPSLRWQRLAGASLLVLANKQDIVGGMTSAEISEVGHLSSSALALSLILSFGSGSPIAPTRLPHLAHPSVLS